MIRQPGRNDLCHCLSGKKYKKCCLPKDLTEEQERLAKANSAVTNEEGEVSGKGSTSSRPAFQETERWRRQKTK